MAELALLLALFQQETITAEEMRAHVQALASDALEGRNAGTVGSVRAAQFVADRFKECGLRAPFEGSFLQKFTFVVRNDGVRRPTIFPKTAETYNVVGILEGTEKPDEYVVVGAHYDHVGKRGQADSGRRDHKRDKGGDDIWNGADDNASGVAALLELAQAFAGAKPKRSVIFIAFSAEEQGLLGSAHYCRHPAVPLEKTVLMVNLDMIGREPAEGVGIHGAASGAGLKPLVEAAVKESDVKAVIHDFGDVREPDSDHEPFFDAGLPTLFFFTGLHEDYHESTDHPEKLNYPSMEKIARCAFGVIRGAADAPERIAFRAPRMLGLLIAGIVSERQAKEWGLEKGTTAMGIAEVREGSPADAAGVEKGDLLLEFNGKKLPLEETKKALRAMIAAVPEGEKVKIVVLRAQKKLELEIVVK